MILILSASWAKQISSRTHTQTVCLYVCVCVPARPHALDNHKASELPPCPWLHAAKSELSSGFVGQAMRAIKAAQRRAASPPLSCSSSSTTPLPHLPLPALRDVNGMLSHYSVNFGAVEAVEAGVEALHSCVARCHLQHSGGMGSVESERGVCGVKGYVNELS